MIAVLLALLLAVSACGGSDPQSQSPAGSARTSATPATTAPADGAPPTDDAIAQALAPWSGDLNGMVERRYIRMLVTFSRTNYFVDRGAQRGVTYEAGRIFEEFVNKRLTSPAIRVHVAFIPVSRDRVFAALAEGRGDLAAANLTITPDRQKLVDFATPFLSDVREVVVTAADQPLVRRVEELAGREVHVRRSSSYYDSLLALNATLKGAGLAPVRIVESSEHLEDEDFLEMVNAGVIPATIVDDHVANLWMTIFDGVRVYPDAAVRTGGRIAWAVRRGAPQLKEAVDAFAAANQKGSLQFNVLFQRYFANANWIRNARSESEARKFRDTVALFRKYGDQYDLPFLLIAAQAYQESQIDQNRRSSAGAVGIMQIKPSTAADAPIGITGVDTSAERNIQAGAKYLRFIVDQYYAGEPMTRLDKGLFAVASYNAGPARIAQLRRTAARIGLDPNRWFGHVEVVAAREIGRETVQYVSNIYKYYVTYQLLDEQMEARRKARGGR